MSFLYCQSMCGGSGNDQASVIKYAALPLRFADITTCLSIFARPTFLPDQNSLRQLLLQPADEDNRSLQVLRHPGLLGAAVALGEDTLPGLIAIPGTAA